MIELFNTPSEIVKEFAVFLRESRLLANLTQKHLANRAKVSVSVLRQFERSGKISLESFVRLAFVLGLTDHLLESLRAGFNHVQSLDDLLKQDDQPKRQRASRQKREGHG